MPSPPPTDGLQSPAGARDEGAIAAIQRVASAFVGARQMGRALPAFPGPLPCDLDAGYAVQEAALALWPDHIVGWKVGLIPEPLAARLGAARLAGPIFSRTVIHHIQAAPIVLNAIEGGFAAIEAELVVSVRADAPPRQKQWSLSHAAAFAGDWFIGAEFAASPLAAINELGPQAVVSDFGNNSGLILGERIDAEIVANCARLQCEVSVDGQRVGCASAAALPGGPLEALRFLLGHTAERGRPLQKGQLVSTGAITGVHRIYPGQCGRIEFAGYGHIDVRIDAAARRDGPGHQPGVP